MPFSPERALRTIAFFPPRLATGGTQRHLLEVLRFLDRTRFHPLVISAKSGGELADAIRELDVELIDLGLGERLLSADLARCVRAAASVFRTRAVDVVQSFQWRPALIALGAARLAGRGRIVAGRRSVPTQHGMRGVLEEIVVQFADRVVVNAESLRPRGRAATRTEVIPSGVDTDRFNPQTADRAAAKLALGLPVDRAAVGTVGRLEVRKGTRTLIEAMALLGDSPQAPSLVVTGEGPLRDELVALAAQLGIAERVHFLGNRGDVSSVLAALDVFVLPSLTEGMSNALLEAMAMALPVVATRVGGNPEVIGDESRGLLVPPDQPQALAAALVRLLGDQGLATRLGGAARLRVEERYGARAMVRQLEGIYAAVAARQPLARSAAPTTAREPA